jgi:flagellar motor switch protein FliN/FliY
MGELMNEIYANGDDGVNGERGVVNSPPAAEPRLDTLTTLKGAGPATLDMLMDVTLQLAVELGRTRMSVRQVLDLQKGSVVELNRMAGDSVDVFVNDHLIARGEVVVVDDKFGIRVTELVPPDRENGVH